MMQPCSSINGDCVRGVGTALGNAGGAGDAGGNDVRGYAGAR